MMNEKQWEILKSQRSWVGLNVELRTYLETRAYERVTETKTEQKKWVKNSLNNQYFFSTKNGNGSWNYWINFSLSPAVNYRGHIVNWFIPFLNLMDQTIYSCSTLWYRIIQPIYILKVFDIANHLALKIKTII